MSGNCTHLLQAKQNTITMSSKSTTELNCRAKMILSVNKISQFTMCITF